MVMIDLPLVDLVDYCPVLDEPDDLESFWQETIDEEDHDLALTCRRVNNKLRVLDTYSLAFSGFGGTRVQGWLHVPSGTTRPLPAVVQYLGYSGGRGFPYSSTIWAQAGYAHLVMDTRGQGWGTGGASSTDDASPHAGMPHAPGFMTLGICDPRTYYYRRVYVDALRLLQAATECDLVDEQRMVVTGASQGGGISLAVAGLSSLFGVQLLGVAPDVPFLCHFSRSMLIATRPPYTEIVQYLAGWRDHADAVYRTLSYFDGVNLAKRAAAPALFSAALMDPICPPSGVYAAFNHYGGERDVDKSIIVYPHNEHEGGEHYQVEAQLDWFASRFAS